MRIGFRIKKSLQQFCLEFLKASSYFHREPYGEVRRVSREPHLRTSAPGAYGLGRSSPFLSPSGGGLVTVSRGWSEPLPCLRTQGRASRPPAGLQPQRGSGWGAGRAPGLRRLCPRRREGLPHREPSRGAGGRRPVGPSGILVYRMVYSLRVVSWVRMVNLASRARTQLGDMPSVST